MYQNEIENLKYTLKVTRSNLAEILRLLAEENVYDLGNKVLDTTYKAMLNIDRALKEQEKPDDKSD